MLQGYDISQRYERNLRLIGAEGQEKLKKSKVLVIGAGGLGSPVLYYLAGAGVGQIGICDGDTVSVSNLNRQILYSEEDLGKSKVEAATRRLQSFNGGIEFRAYPYLFEDENGLDLCKGYDIIVDCLDNMKSRYLLNDLCLELNLPFVHGGIGEYYGQQITIIPNKGPCLRCVLPEGHEEQKSFTGGTLGPVPGVIAGLQALETIKYLLGEKINDQHLLVFDGFRMEFEKISVLPNPACRCRLSVCKRDSGLMPATLP